MSKKVLSLILLPISCNLACKPTPVHAKDAPDPAFLSKLNQDNLVVLRKHGDYVNYAEFRATFSPQDPDSTPLYRKAHSLLPEGISKKLKVSSTTNPDTGPDLVQKLLSQNAAAIELIEKAAQMKRPAWDMDSLVGWSDPDENLWLMDFGSLISERARLKISAGDFEGFLADYRLIDQIAYQAIEYNDESGAEVLSNLGRRSLLTPFLNTFKDDRLALEKFLEYLGSRRPVPDPFEYLKGKAASCIYIYEDESRLKERLTREFGKKRPDFVEWQTKEGVLTEASRLAAADECVRRVAELWLYADRRKGRAYKYHEIQNEFYLHGLEIQQDPRPLMELVTSLMPTPFWYHQSTSNLYVRHNIALILLKLALLRLENGHWPEQLPDWGELTDDPFSYGKLIYKRTYPGFIIYSVGYDGSDDGGSSMSQDYVGDLTSRIRFD